MKTAVIIFIVLAVFLGGIAYYFYDQNEKTKMELQAKIADLSVQKDEELDRLTDTYEKLVITVLDETKEVCGFVARIVEEREWKNDELYCPECGWKTETTKMVLEQTI